MIAEQVRRQEYAYADEFTCRLELILDGLEERLGRGGPFDGPADGCPRPIR